MPIKVKLLDRDLIRLVGSTIAIINDSHARKYIKAGRAIAVDEKKPEDEKKRFEDKRKKDRDRPPEDKTMWIPPEKKTFSSIPKNITSPFPGPNDTLFPQI